MPNQRRDQHGNAFFAHECTHFMYISNPIGAEEDVIYVGINEF